MGLFVEFKNMHNREYIYNKRIFKRFNFTLLTEPIADTTAVRFVGSLSSPFPPPPFFPLAKYG
jgi:hypothetical protein